MGSPEHHWKLAVENRDGAESELRAGRYSNVGLLAVKSLEQAVEACAAREELHFHEEPLTAHSRRRKWLSSNFPELTKNWDILWSVYATLGYGGSDGEKARVALRALDRALEVLRGICLGRI